MDTPALSQTPLASAMRSNVNCAVEMTVRLTFACKSRATPKTKARASVTNSRSNYGYDPLPGEKLSVGVVAVAGFDDAVKGKGDEAEGDDEFNPDPEGLGAEEGPRALHAAGFGAIVMPSRHDE